MSQLPTPKGRQSDVVHLSSDRHNVVLGTAGTGKSTMAMLRALHLARTSTANSGPVLVVTYNNTLVTYLRYLGPAIAGQLTIETYGRFARGYLASLGRMGWNKIAKPDKVRSLIYAAMTHEAATGISHAVLGREVDWMTDEIHWISGMGLRSEAEFQAVDRVGRLTRLAAPARAAVWATRQHYLTMRAAAGYDYDWYDIAGSVTDALTTDTRPRNYRHIIIDEGQDLSPQAIRSLVAAVQDGGSLTFFGDYHQAIYGQGLSWRASGIELGGRRVERFVDNYRNTTQIANVALAMTNSVHMASATNDDLVIPRAPVAAGPLPTLVQAGTRDKETAFLRDLVTEVSKDQAVAVLARTWADARRLVASMPYVALSNEMGTWTGAPGIYVGAYHSAKGLEFDAVVMPYLDDDVIPNRDVLASYEEVEANAREARLLYVAITRAKVTLVMSHSGPLTRLLPPNQMVGAPAGTPLWTVEKL